MKTLTYNKPHDLPKLHDALIAAVPDVFVRVNPDGSREAIAVVESAGDEIRLSVPDAADESAIASVVTAHDPSAILTAQQAEETQAQQLRQQIVDLAQSAVGVTLSALTQAQRNALTACLLWQAGGVTNDMKIKPLGEWLK